MGSTLDIVQTGETADGLLLTDTTAHSGRYNMAVDKHLLELAMNSSIPFVRIYRWRVPTISLGYFQPPDVSVEDRWTACPRVRRLTGGGAILHDQELTYSVLIPASHPLHADPYRLYETVHRGIIALLTDCGATARLRSDVPFEQTEDGFLCFLRRDPNDVVTDSRSGRTDKVIGSAQRRRKGTILQHGSILLRQSALTTELPGICDLCSHFDEDHFHANLGNAIAASLKIQQRIEQSTENFIDSKRLADDD